ncbi:MAG: hypothetical protein J6B37_02615 [Clostridia bacterium]|nr:hypothetical protein [Clostridia bacterium]
MNYDEYVKQLNEMYDEIYCNKSCGNRCEHWEKCKPKDPNKPVKFYFDRVKVGKEYGTIYPKILFAGLEGVHGEVEDLRITEISEPSLTKYNPHYKGVRYVLSYLLANLSNETPPINAKKSELSKDMFVEHLKHYCLTNIYKCAFGLPKDITGLTHTEEMKNECFKIFLKEIEVLHPEIVVIQIAKNAPDNLWNSMIKAYGNKEELLKRAERNAKTSAYRLKYNDGTPFYCIWTYHGNGAPFAKQRGGRFGNNNVEYIENELNPVLDEVIEQFLKNK